MNADLRDQLAAALPGVMDCREGCPDCGRYADALLPTVQRLIEEAKREAVAGERRRVADSFQIRSLDPS